MRIPYRLNGIPYRLNDRLNGSPLSRVLGLVAVGACAAGGAVAGCSSSDNSHAPFASDGGADATDATNEAGGDATADTGGPSRADTGTGFTQDTGADATGDAGMDDSADAGGDDSADAGADATAEAGVDAAPEAGVDASGEAGADASPDAGTDGPCVPTTPPLCNGKDNNCDGVVDEGCPTSVSVDTSSPTATSSMNGDTGGGAWGPDTCPSGQALVGVSGYSGGNLDQYEGVCGTLSIFEDTSTSPYTYTVQTGTGTALPARGNNVTTPFSVMCPNNQVVTRIDGYYDLAQNGTITQGVHQVSVYCSSLTAQGTPTAYSLVASAPTLAGSTPTNYNLSQSTSFSFACPSNGVIAAESGRSGSWVDALQYECFAPTLTMRP